MRMLRTTQLSLKIFLTALLSVSFVGCTDLLGRMPPKPTHADYIAVDYRRFVSGVYVDELANKYVKVECTFASVMAGNLPANYPSPRYMAFQVMRPSTSPGIADSLNVVVPKDLGDIIFGLRNGEQIRVYGRAVPVMSRRRGGTQLFKDLILEADLIEKT